MYESVALRRTLGHPPRGVTPVILIDDEDDEYYDEAGEAYHRAEAKYKSALARYSVKLFKATVTPLRKRFVHLEQIWFGDGVREVFGAQEHWIVHVYQPGKDNRPGSLPQSDLGQIDLFTTCQVHLEADIYGKRSLIAPHGYSLEVKTDLVCGGTYYGSVPDQAAMDEWRRVMREGPSFSNLASGLNLGPIPITLSDIVDLYIRQTARPASERPRRGSATVGRRGSTISGKRVICLPHIPSSRPRRKRSSSRTHQTLICGPQKPRRAREERIATPPGPQHHPQRRGRCRDALSRPAGVPIGRRDHLQATHCLRATTGAAFQRPAFFIYHPHVDSLYRLC